MEQEALDKVARFVLNLRRNSSAFASIRTTSSFTATMASGRGSLSLGSHLVNRRPDGSIPVSCASLIASWRARDDPARNYESPEVRKIIAQSPEMWTFCKGCKIGCPYEVSAYRNSPLTAMRSALDFLQSPEADSRVAASPMVTEEFFAGRGQRQPALEAPASDSAPCYRAGYHVSGCSRARPRQALQRWDEATRE